MWLKVQDTGIPNRITKCERDIKSLKINMQEAMIRSKCRILISGQVMLRIVTRVRVNVSERFLIPAHLGCTGKRAIQNGRTCF